MQTQKIIKTWTATPGVVACYTGTASRSMRRNHRVVVRAEALGKCMLVEIIGSQNKGRLIVVKAKNLAPIQADLFVRCVAN